MFGIYRKDSVLLEHEGVGIEEYRKKSDHADYYNRLGEQLLLFIIRVLEERFNTTISKNLTKDHIDRRKLVHQLSLKPHYRALV